MATKKTSIENAPARRRGRPLKVESPINDEATVSRATILQHAIGLTKHTPLDEISMVQLAKDFGVAPGLIHYYLGGRDKLVSGVLNNYYRERLNKLPSLTGNWRSDIEAIARISFKVAVENPGVSIYVSSHNRFRLFQDVEPGEVDYGTAFFSHVASAFMQGGFSPEQVALAYHLLAQFLLASGVAEAARQIPAYHQEFIRKRLESAPAHNYPGAHYVSSAFAALDSSTAFGQGLKLLLDGFESWQQTKRKQPVRKSVQK